MTTYTRIGAGASNIAVSSSNPTTDYMEDVIFGSFGDVVSVTAKGKTLLKFGDRTDLGTGMTTLAQFGSGILNEDYQTTNSITHIASTSANDTEEVKYEYHTVSGTGTDAQFTFGIGTVTLQGQTKTALPVACARVSRVYNNDSTLLEGTVYVAQDVTFTSGVPQTAAAIHAVISAGEQQTFKAATTISNSDYYILTSGLVEVGKKTNAVVDFRLEVRQVGGVFRPVAFATCGQGDMQTIDINPPAIVPKNADVRITAAASTTNVEAGGWFNGYLAAVQS